MADLTAGDTVRALDFPAVAFDDEGADESNVSSTSFTAGSTVCSDTCIVGTTGKLRIDLYALLRGDGTNQLFVSFELYEGSDETGTLVLGATESRSVRIQSSDLDDKSTFWIEEGLTVGATHFVRTMHRVNGGTTADVLHRRVALSPVS